MPAGLSRAARSSSAASTGSSTSTTRCSAASAGPGRMWAIEHYGVEPGSARLGQVDRRRPAARRGHGQAGADGAPHPGGLGGTFGGNPLSCAAAAVVLDAVAEPGLPARAPRRWARRIRARLEEIAARHAAVGEVRGLGPDARARARGAGSRRSAGALAARSSRRLSSAASLLLACGLVRQRDPLLAAARRSRDDDLDEGLDAPGGVA